MTDTKKLLREHVELKFRCEKAERDVDTMHEVVNKLMFEAREKKTELEVTNRALDHVKSTLANTLIENRELAIRATQLEAELANVLRKHESDRAKVVVTRRAMT